MREIYLCICHDSNAVVVCAEFSYEACYDTVSNQSWWYHISEAFIRWILYDICISITILQIWLITIWLRGREWAARVCDVVPWHLGVVWRIVTRFIRIYDVTFWNLNNALLRIYAVCGASCGWGVSLNVRKSQFNFKRWIAAYMNFDINIAVEFCSRHDSSVVVVRA